MSFRELSIEDFAQVVSGGTPSTNIVSYWDGGISWITPKDLSSYSARYIHKGERDISDEGLKNSSARIVPENTVLLTTRAPVGYVALAGVPLATNQGFKNLLCNKSLADPTFVFYLLKNNREVLESHATGATFKELSGSRLKAIKLRLPEVVIQKRIADTLSAYDDLMENNRRRMILLEDAARLLYREWFVLLRFPGHKRLQIKNGVPEGWVRKPLSELTSFLKRGITPSYDDDAEGIVINQKCVRGGRVDLNLARHQSREFTSERQVKVGDVLVNSTGEGTLGRIAQVRVLVENCTIDTHVTIVRPKIGIPLHYFGMAVMALEEQFSTMGRGATNQTELSPSAIGETQILMPPKVLLEQFEMFVGPIFKQVTNFVGQNNQLKATRDILLPRLMSGEIAV